MRGTPHVERPRPAARDEAVERGVDEVIATNNGSAGTSLALHYQTAYFEEAKTLGVTGGAPFDLMVDLRVEEPTYVTSIGVRLASTDDLALHIRPGVAHAYQTLEDDNTRLTYVMQGASSPDHGQTLRWDDPPLGIARLRPVSRISEKDHSGSACPPA
jgi:dTDP-4-dehydrorhamnose 3,5-epimerase